MKKKYSTPNLIKAVSLSAAMATLLSSVSPVFAAGVSTVGGLVRNSSGTNAPYPFGSHGSIVFAGDDDYCGVDNVKGRGGVRQENLSNKITAKEEFENFIVDQADNNSRNPYGTTTKQVSWVGPNGILSDPKASYMGTNTGGSENILPEAYGVYSFVTGCGASAIGNYSTAFGAGATTKAGGAQAFGVAALASGKASVAMGVSSEASGDAAVAVGGLATASGSRSIAIGVDSHAKASGSIAIGSRRSDRTNPSNPVREVLAEAINAIAIGTYTYAKGEDSVAIGANAQALHDDGVAIGGGSVSRRAKGDKGYDPATGQETEKNGEVWVSTASAFSVGDVGDDAEGYKITRQITGVAAGKEDTDAVNVAQLKAMENLISGAWKVSVNGGKDPTDVSAGNTVDFSVAMKNPSNNVGKDNLTIKKNSTNVKFTLNDTLKLTKVITGQSTMSGDGFFANGEEGPRMTVDGFYINNANGPSMTVEGIDAGSQKITKVKDGTDLTDAVNYKQLKEIEGKISEAGGWKLSVNGENDATDVAAGNKVDFSVQGTDAGKDNLKIEKNSTNVKFTLNDQLELTKVTTGQSTMSGDGFFADGANGPRMTVDGFYVNKADGPNMTKNGIDAGKKKIINVTEATNDYDAVNYKQLKEIKEAATTHWQLTVNGKDATSIGQNDTVNLQSASKGGSQNIKIVGDNIRNVTFDLADNINVMTVTAGESVMDAAGFRFDGGEGPSITVKGIHAGNTTVKGVADGVLEKDAVNLSQLNKVKDQITSNSLVKWEENRKRITIGKEKDGTEINIANKSNGNRTISGVKNGRLYQDSTEAVNGSQLWDTNEKVGSLDKIVTNISGTVTDISEDVYNIETKVDKVAEDAVRYDRDVSGQKTNKITLKGGDTSAPVSITNIADGLINGYSTDAINGSQIHSMGSDIAKFFGGGTEFNNGKFSEPEYVLSHVSTNGTVEREAYNNVGSALTGLDANVKNVNSRLTYVTNDFNQKFDKFSQDALLWSDAKQAFVALHKKGGETTESKITSLLNGDITEDSTDAINGSQIHSMGSDIAKFFGGNISFENGKFTGPKYELKIIEEDGSIAIKRYDNVGSALDAVNTNVFAVDHRITVGFLDIADYFGGGAKYEKGKWQAPTFKVYKINADGSVSQQPYDNVADAFEGVNNTFANIHNQISDITKNSLVKWDEDEKLITIGAEKDGVEINISNKDEKPRVISGVREGLYDDEAVNVAQLKEVKELAKNGWKLSVNDDENNVTDVKAGSTVDFSVKDTSKEGVGKDNLKIEKDDKNQVIFSLNDNLKLTSVTTDNSTMSDDGFIIKNGPHMTKDGIFVNDNDGPSMTMEGIDAGKKVIKNVAEGKNDTDAVNFSQLQGIKNQIENDSLVKWEEEKKLITIGKEKGGTTINITNKDNQPRLIVGVADGKISDGSKDAINGSQINKISEDIAKFFGGGAKFVDGAFKGLKYTLSAIVNGEVGKANFYDVGSALTGLDKNVQDVNQRLTKVSNEFNQTIEGISKDALLWDDEEEAFVARHEKDGKKTKSKLKYLLDGDIAKGSTDAITGNQLYLMSNQLANYFGGGAGYKDGKWTDPTFKISKVGKDGKTVKTEHHNVADAFGDINDGMSNINNRINEVINKVDTDALKWNENKKAYDASRDGKPSKITGVADGKIAEGSKDAVNGGQLWETNERITGVEKDVKHISNRVDNISNTIADIGGIVNNIDGKVNNINNRVDVIEEDAVRYDRDENGKKTNKITLAGGDASEPVLIDNVANGKIEKGSKEAVNGGQLHDYTKEQTKLILDESKQYTDQRIRNITIDAIDDAVERARQYTDTRFNVLNYSIESVKKEARQAAAIGLAVSNLRYNDTPGKLSVGFGAGLWRSQSAFAFGAGYTSENGKYRSNISATTSGGHWGVGAGFNMTLN
ncbi:Vomp family autotransporter [Bartonella queenslandensis]|uniref:Vomp family autotransporter n=1 Tax=Bartonella queenslandensis TaxID=481138 RepID=UPI001BA7098D|nr:Vomp family autotransporter [Bartonella queenslandensis]